MDPGCSLRGLLDFLGGPVVKNPPANAGDSGSIPGPGRFQMEQLSPHATATEAHAIQSLSTTTREATTVRGPHTAAAEGPQVAV